MASSWIIASTTKSGGKRYLVRFRTGGRESTARHAGSFPTKTEAIARKRWIDGELAALRVPDLHVLEREPVRTPTVAEAAERWQASRVDLAENTKTRHALELNRIRPLLGSRRVDELSAADVAEFVATLTAEGYARSHAPQDAADAADGPGRRRRRRERRPRASTCVCRARSRRRSTRRAPPTSRPCTGFCRRSTGCRCSGSTGAVPRVSSVDLTLVGDYDEPRRRVRLRAATTKTRKALWVELHPALADALEAQLGPREDRDPGARLFAGSGADALRTSIAKACRAAAIPLWSPHDLRHRRISLLHLRGVPWAVIGLQVGQRDISVTADTYSHVLSDERELDYEAMLL